MAINPVTKCLALVGGIGGVCGGGFWIVNNINRGKKSVLVKDRLSSDGYKLLNLKDTSSEGWTRVKAAYEAENNNDKRFSNIKKNGDSITSEITENCKELLEKEEVSDLNYLKARRWCVVPITVGSKFPSGALLDYSESNSGDDNLWNKLANKHWGVGIDEKLKISNESKSDEGEKRTEIKLKCKGSAESDSTNESFYEVVNKVNMWCTKESANAIS